MTDDFPSMCSGPEGCEFCEGNDAMTEDELKAAESRAGGYRTIASIQGIESDGHEDRWRIPASTVAAIAEDVFALTAEVRDLAAKASDAKNVAATARGEMAIVTTARDEYQKLARAMIAERDEWRSLAGALRAQDSRISGTLMDSGITFEGLPEGVAALRAERDALRSLVDCATRFDIGDVRIIRIAGPASMWWVCPRDKDHEMVDTRDAAIARARDLAKEST